MKNKGNNAFALSVLLFLCALIFNSCSLKKNLTAGGFTLWHHTTNGIKKQEFSKHGISFTHKQETTFNFIPSQIANDKVNPEINEHEKGHAIPLHKQYKKERKTTPLKQHRLTDPKKPAATGKYKLTISQVNTIAIISFLLIPVMILGFFIQGGLGAAIALTALILGVGLALFSLAIGAKRRGVWAPGIAAGFWLVILIYLSLLIFVF